MSLLNIVSLAAAMVTVDYLGGTIAIPENHEWVAMTKLDCNNGESKGLLVSYEVEPTVSRNGYYVAVPGTDHRILGEVEYQDPRGSLRRVQGHDREEAIMSNAEELAYKIAAVLDQVKKPHDAIHALFCPDHGVVSEFLKTTAPMLHEYFTKDEPEYTGEVHQTAVSESVAEEASPRIVNMTGKPVPEDVMVQLLTLLALAAKADGIGRA